MYGPCDLSLLALIKAAETRCASLVRRTEVVLAAAALLLALDVCCGCCRSTLFVLVMTSTTKPQSRARCLLDEC